MDNSETQLTRLCCQIEVMSTLLNAVVRTHPDKLALLRSIERCVRETNDLILVGHQTSPGDYQVTFQTVIKGPSAFLPVAMSVAALTVVLVHIAMFGTAREADEGAAAHLWQILIVGQLPVMAFFAIKWLPQAPRSVLSVLALQAGAVLAAFAPVYFLNL